MVNQAFRIKIAYWSKEKKKKEEEEKENTRDRWVPDGSDKNVYFWFYSISCSHQSWSLSSCRTWTFCLHQKLTLHTIFKSGCQSPRHPLKVRRGSKS